MNENDPRGTDGQVPRADYPDTVAGLLRDASAFLREGTETHFHGDLPDRIDAFLASDGCLAKARPGEPAFTMLGRDPDAPTLVREWGVRRAYACQAAGLDPSHALSALAVADAMAAYGAEPGNAPSSAPPAAAYPETPAEQTEVLRDTADRLILTGLVVRFFRVMILGGVVIPDTPAAMDWLRDYIDGTHKVHGPLGKPMVWPDRLPSIVSLLRDWGFQPTPTIPPYVSMRPGGKMADIELPQANARALASGYAEEIKLQTDAKAALRPFALAFKNVGTDDDGEWAKMRLLVGDYRRAAEAYAGMGGDLSEEDGR